MKTTAIASALLLLQADKSLGFQGSQSSGPSRTVLNAAASRRSFITDSVAFAAAAALSTTAAVPGPANAFGGGLNKINDKLRGYGLPTMESLPSGFSPLLELYGRDGKRDLLLVQFAHPSDWVVTLPSQDVNGEDGTIQAGQYSAGDTATLFVMEDKHVDDITAQDKSFYEDAIIRSISQKGNNIYQSFKLKKVTPVEGELKGQKYVLVDFSYTLLTGAGFEVDRIGTASITNAGKSTQVLWCASTTKRYKKTEPQLRDITKSFRVYADGLNLSSQLSIPDDGF